MAIRSIFRIGLITIALITVLIFSGILTPQLSAQTISVAFDTPEYTVKQGDVINGSIPVTNATDQPVAVRIYIGDWMRVPKQSSGYVFDIEGGKEPRSFLKWMTFSPERMTLGPHETRDVTYEVIIPENKKDSDNEDNPEKSKEIILDGSYWGVIFIEGIPEEEPEFQDVGEDEIGVGIRTIFRYAIQVFATIEGSEIRKAKFTSINMEEAQGGFNVTAVMQNDGNIFFKPKVWLQLRDVTGKPVYEQEHGEMTMLPESSREFRFELRNLPIESGEYLVMVIADYGVPKLIAAQGRLDYTTTQPPLAEEKSGTE